jgi:hypothetical protein
MQKLDNLYFQKIYIKFGFKILYSFGGDQFIINKNRGMFLFKFPHSSPNGKSVWVNFHRPPCCMQSQIIEIYSYIKTKVNTTY